MVAEDRYAAAVQRVMPLRRGQEPVDVGWMTAFLASDLARNFTAQAINVDGGEVLH
jgi:enoyl-[acyl-carrier-protein] reductase (NADH)